MLPTCFPGRPRPPESRPIVRNIKHRSGILLPVCCRHAGSPRNSSSRRSTSANITWDTSSKPGTTSKPMVHSMILRVETWWKRTGPTSPDRLWAISSPFVDRFRRGRLFLDRPVAQRRFQRWRTLTGSSFLLRNFMSRVGSLDGKGLPQMCRTWIYRKNPVSDNRGSYENWPYLRCLSTDFEKVDCSETSRWSSVVFQDGGPKPEVVLSCTILCRGRVLSTEKDCPRCVERGSIEESR